MFYHFPKIQLREMKNGGEFFYKDTYISKTEDVRKVKIYILNLHYKVSLRAKFLAPNVSSSQDMDISKNVRTKHAKRARNQRQLVIYNSLVPTIKVISLLWLQTDCISISGKAHPKLYTQ